MDDATLCSRAVQRLCVLLSDDRLALSRTHPVQIHRRRGKQSERFSWIRACKRRGSVTFRRQWIEKEMICTLRFPRRLRSNAHFRQLWA